MRCSRPQTALSPRVGSNGPAGPTPHHPLRGSFPSRGSRFFILFPTQFPRKTDTGDHRSPLRWDERQALSDVCTWRCRGDLCSPANLHLKTSQFTAMKKTPGRLPSRPALLIQLNLRQQSRAVERTPGMHPYQTFTSARNRKPRVWARRPSAGRGEVGVQRESRGDRCGVPPDSLWPERSGAPHQHPYANRESKKHGSARAANGYPSGPSGHLPSAEGRQVKENEANRGPTHTREPLWVSLPPVLWQEIGVL